MTDWRMRTRRLALSYLGIIMVMSLVFSWIIYFVTSNQLGRPLPPPRSEAYTFHRILYEKETKSRLVERDRQTRESMIVSLIILNVCMLGGGAWFSLYLAKRTLRPIELAMAAQNQFISDASHELKTPLTALQATNEVALRKKHLDAAKAREVLEKNSVEVDKLQTLTEDLFTMNEADTVVLEKEPVMLDVLAGDTVAMLKDVADKKSITITTDVACVSVMANAVALRQIITILVDNAIKYSPEHAMVTVTSERQKQAITLQIRDTGMGIADKDKRYIFDRFYRVDKARTRTDASGHGLGLSIALALCRRQGFTLNLKESREGYGSTFEVAIPMKEA